ncbi:zinc finger CCCH domain-containing protein 18-like isoform X1 [Lycium barbarum]|uniref:zinc finger CCCH domain-containing protein 18-like isoform X1 n=1 Tax=Lycium barbarum TaxID=112863 RepID=UPI00293F6D2A|nr:zinc finger CCCH domain-containing protein 18-like isoform X1 [Lycium barbarum]XP_060188007.1 zinc finger CCCH domain-containing protein 18-like isoform X1 [Lycium barbarum]XP_060188008.1 zinc finger CCCH domain-containing protein 18-like isoform X1 [Lycium barbarum]XP_060188009.1 zinc finger CCCH domain-containing protein 18-like isoform X1 [Lycium barbarum]XP_060188010.1 zinc finger CCCH domain-containing protein 18-like isoform X1 [Lycium barbarum]XP_060188011.1 zinc finger CCCH domain-c
MDPFEAARLVHERIMRVEPEHVTRKIIGYIYLQDYPDQEMIRLALGPDTLIHNVIQKAKDALKLNSTPAFRNPSISPVSIADPVLQFSHLSPLSPCSFSSAYLTETPYSVYEPPQQFLRHEETLDSENLNYPSDYCYPEAAFIRRSRNFLSPLKFPVKACHYFNKGFCRNGTSCQYFHGHPLSESYPHMIGPNICEYGDEDEVLSPGSLEKLELEITELLKYKKGHPVSIASLPMMYYEKYGRTLQAEGYLTESQRHGKAGYNLTKLLARLKFVHLIERPHGQHSVVLAEDASRYMDPHGERSDPGPIVNGSRQIYLTFPAESTFTEEDVSDYFNTFGPVQDVRMPCQQKRMFGFVTFFSADTVKMVLSTGNPHYVCGARVLVKPYREKPKLPERKYQEKLESSIFYHLQHADFDSGRHARFKSPRLLRKHLMEEQVLELESRRLAQLQLSRRPMASLSYFRPPMDEFNISQPERSSHLLDVRNSGSSDEDNFKYSGSHDADDESNQPDNLPDSPFASAVTSSVSEVL